MATEDKPQGAALEGALEHALRDIGIPARPAILDRMEEEMHKEEPDFNRLGTLISADVGLAAGLVKTVNAPYYGLSRRARSVHEALLILGLDVAGRAVAGLSLRRAFPVTPEMERFWDGSACIAALSGWLADFLRKPRLRPEDAYTYGLFRDSGIPILLLRFPDYEHVLRQANEEPEAAFTEVELKSLPTEHAMVGCLMAQTWWLPEEICLAIRHHHDKKTIDLLESRLPLASRYMVAVGQLSEHLFQRISGKSHTSEWGKLGASSLRLLGLEEGDLPDLQTQAADLLKSLT